MKFSFTLLFILLNTYTFVFSQLAENSELANGNIYKIGITKDGIYKIDATLLQSLGIDLNAVDPTNIRVLGYGGGMLPQANSAKRFDDLIENAVKVQGGGDGNFNAEDYILFYARGPHKLKYNKAEEKYQYETNLFSDTSYYFIKLDSKVSKKVEELDEIAETISAITTFDELIHHEIDETNLLNEDNLRGGVNAGSGRRWFGERFDFNRVYDFSFSAQGIVEDSLIKLNTSLMSSSPVGGVFNISYNQNAISKVTIPPVVESTYGIKGRIAESTYEFPSTSNSAINITFEYEKKTSASKDAGYLDFFTIHYKKRLGVYDNQTTFRSAETLNNTFSKFIFANESSEFEVWDITLPENVYQCKLKNENNASYFIASSDTLKEFVAFRGSDFDLPIPIGKVNNQNLHALNPTNLIIITPDFLKAEAQELADFREINDNLSARVVIVDEIYNEFSSGRQDITALRDFIRFIYRKGSGNNSLRYVLLFGDGSYDYKNRTAENANGSLIPIYQSYESLHPIYSYSSDDYFAFMDEAEGAWSEDSQDVFHDMDIGIGRLPINNLQEAQAVVDKLKRYSSTRESLGNWRKKILFVADDGDANTHQLQANRLGILVENNFQQFNANRIFVDAFPHTIVNAKRFSPAVREEINRNIDEGVLIVNYSGHGSELRWADESILTTAEIKNWDNTDRLPLFVTATCEFGRYDDPVLKSGAEYAMVNPNGGAIGLLTTTRPVFSNTNFLLNQAFYDAVFEPVEGEMPRLGDVLTKTKNNSNAGVVNRNFALLGDPSMKLAYPQENIVVTSVKNKNVEEVDTISALDFVQLEGEIRRNDQIASDFDGLMELTVFDKLTTITTLGDEGPNTVMEFEDLQSVIHRGKVSVSAGKFKAEFVVPKGISYNFDYGKISLYAQHKDEVRDASGHLSDLMIGGSSYDFDIDNTPPELSLLLEDSSFVDGSTVPSNTILYANIFDENGINITGNGIEQEIIAILDEEQTYYLNDYFITALDD
ncbi:MAG: type IX secretion system sortase PorU, partial [Bacteroidota bacterium]